MKLLSGNMRETIGRAALLLGVLAIMGAVRVEAAEVVGKPGNEVIATIERVKAIVQTEKSKVSEAQLDTKLKDAIAPRFNFREMSQRSLGPTWATVKEVEREEFADLFGDLLGRTYISKIRNNIETSKISLADEKVDGAKAIVRTKVNDGKDDIQIDYRLKHEAEGWKVYDVIVENVGLVSTYRDEFDGIIRREGFKGLMEKLRAKQIKADVGKKVAS